MIGSLLNSNTVAGPPEFKAVLHLHSTIQYTLARIQRIW